MEVLFTGVEDGKFALYAETTTSSGRRGLIKSIYQGENYNFASYGEVYDEIDAYKSFKEYLKHKYCPTGEVEKNSSSEASVLAQISEYKSYIESYVNDIRKLEKKEFKNNSLLTSTTELDNYRDFAEKLYGDKEIIYAGVSDLSARTPTNDFFNSNYCESFKVLSVFQDNGNIVISIKEIFVPWYSDSTTESLYKSFFENKYQISSEQTIIVTDPVEVQRLAEYATASVAVYDLYGYEDIMETEEENDAIKERMPKSVLVLTK